jgi:hypothetical protein
MILASSDSLVDHLGKPWQRPNLRMRLFIILAWFFCVFAKKNWVASFYYSARDGQGRSRPSQGAACKVWVEAGALLFSAGHCAYMICLIPRSLLVFRFLIQRRFLRVSASNTRGCCCGDDDDNDTHPLPEKLQSLLAQTTLQPRRPPRHDSSSTKHFQDYLAPLQSRPFRDDGQ